MAETGRAEWTRRPSQDGRQSGRVDYLDGIRAVAIALVVVLHWCMWVTPLFRGGVIGVDLFFVLSGFIITTVLWRSRPPTVGRGYLTFVVARVRRLYPALLGLVAGAVVLYAVFPGAFVSPGEVAQRGLVALGQGVSLWGANQTGEFLIPGMYPFSHTWSLAVEWYFYLLWPLAVLACRHRGVSARTLALASLVPAVALYVFSLVTLNAFEFYYGPLARIPELLAGAALGLWFQSLDGPPRPSRLATPLASAALAGLVLFALFAPGAVGPGFRYVGVPAAVGAGLVLIWAGYSNPEGPVSRLLRRPMVAGLGRVSYSLYLWHVVPVVLIEQAEVDLPLPVVAVGIIALTVALTAASYRWLERPFVRSRSDVLQRPAQPAGSQPQAPVTAPVSHTAEPPTAWEMGQRTGAAVPAGYADPGGGSATGR